mgnify:CR=1 FL=1
METHDIEPHPFQEAVDVLDHFFDRMDSGTVFAPNPFADFRTWRQRIRRALFTLLLDGRPWLEARRSLDWPYDALQQHAPFLEAAAVSGATAVERQEARRFLALLPFPGQWRHLRRLAAVEADSPEIALLLSEEHRKIEAKLAKKRQKTFKLRHFCQILKAPRLPQEKGVLRIFSLPYLFYSVPGLLTRLSEQYVIYLEPPWGVLARHAWLRVFSDLADPVVIGAGGPEDCRFLATQPNVLPIPLAHGDYLEPNEDVPLEASKTVDIVFNGLFDDMPRKRHGVVLDLLMRPELNRLTALFLGRGAARNVAAFRRQVAERGLEGRVTVFDNLPRHDVPRHLAPCRVGIQISLHENVCRSIYEFFRSDIPCLVSSSMAGFNFDLITPENGVIAADEALPEALRQMLADLPSFQPRAWFLRHSGSIHAGRRLNDHLRSLFLQLGYEWQEDIVPLSSSGANRYIDPEDYRRFLPEFRRLFRIFKAFPLPIALAPE